MDRKALKELLLGIELEVLVYHKVHKEKTIAKRKTRLTNIDILAKAICSTFGTKEMSVEDLCIEILIAKRGCSRKSAETLLTMKEQLATEYREDVFRIAQAIHNLIYKKEKE